jgi:hypothetical protein
VTDKVKKAIEQLERISNSLASIGETEDYTDIAIQALEQEPCEDCVSRQVVKEMLTAEWTKYMPMEMDVSLSFILDKINVLPSVTPKAETEAYNKGYTDAMRDIGDAQ